MKKISGLVTAIAITGILTVGLNTFTKSSHYVNRGDTGGAPARPDFAPAYEHGKTWISGGIVVEESHADFPAPQES
ncbi:Phr family secreted Rap phosphatase inhibitor [Bacillus sp. NPDC094106]|uniref:Phr family secreted Rap phosphatase inhibitor n=1 Tax=Bacillus sp. NPDC094106 TaxID=3363949 RepID=UPI003802C186